MSTIRDIKRRLKSVENIKQIAKAMEMVAASRLRRAQTKAKQSHPYTIKIHEILRKVPSDQSENPFFEKREVKTIGLVIVAGDRGLCGSYNSNIISAAMSFLDEHQDKDIKLILVGKKTIEHFRSKKWPIAHQISKWGGKITFSEVKKLANDIVSKFLIKEYDEVWMVYSHFVNIMTRKIKVEKFLNIERLEEPSNSKDVNYLYEPNPAEIFSEIIPRYCITKIQNILDEAYASELAARVVSMRSASKNADEMKVRLILTRNKVRQESITKEMLEITSGAEGLK